MPLETRLLGFGIGSRMTRQQMMGPNGPETDANGMPVTVPVLELMLIDQQKGDVIIIPLTEEGVDVMKKALSQSNIVIPQPGAVPIR